MCMLCGVSEQGIDGEGVFIRSKKARPGQPTPGLGEPELNAAGGLEESETWGP